MAISREALSSVVSYLILSSVLDEANFITAVNSLAPSFKQN